MTHDPLAPFRAAASPEQRAACPGPPVICKRCNTSRRGGCLCGRDGDELAWLPGDRGYPTPAPPEQRGDCLHPVESRCPIFGGGSWVCEVCSQVFAPTDALTPERLDAVERRAREASERASKATTGPWGHKAGVLKHYCFSTDEREDFGFSQQELHWEDGREVPAEANCVFIAAAREDVPVLAAAALVLSAEVRRMRIRLDRVTHERECLGTAIADAALKAGIYSGVPVTGPELILLAQEIANVIVRAQVARDPRVAIGEMAVDSGEEEA